mgnify:CR=1 FL=1
MKKLFAGLVSFFVIAFCQAQNIQPLPVGSLLPMGDIKMKEISGKEVSIKNAAQINGVLVMFSCNTCPVVIRNQDRTKMITAFAKKNNIGVILFDSNEGGREDGYSFRAMQSYARLQGFNFY